MRTYGLTISIWNGLSRAASQATTCSADGFVNFPDSIHSPTVAASRQPALYQAVRQVRASRADEYEPGPFQGSAGANVATSLPMVEVPEGLFAVGFIDNPFTPHLSFRHLACRCHGERTAELRPVGPSTTLRANMGPPTAPYRHHASPVAGWVCTDSSTPRQKGLWQSNSLRNILLCRPSP